MRIIRKYWFIIAFAVSLIYPTYGRVTDGWISLNGVIEEPERVELNFNTLGNGDFQKSLNSLWETDFPGRSFLVKCRNQLLYTFFESPNKNVAIGKDHYLFSNLSVPKHGSPEYFENLEKKLLELDTVCKNNGLELYVFVTPAKTRYEYDYIPMRYKIAFRSDVYDETNYSRFIEALDKSGVSYFDSIELIEQHIDDDTLRAPIFCRTGHHWTQPWGKYAAVKFIEYMNSKSQYDMASLRFEELQCDSPVHPDADLYKTLNIFTAPKDTWYNASISVEEEKAEKPNVFLRGGSFMGQSLSGLVRAGVFGTDVDFQNYYYFTNRYSTTTYISSFRAYDEVPLEELLEDKNIIILEVNEGAILDMSWGFIDYLLEHQELIS